MGKKDWNRVNIKSKIINKLSENGIVVIEPVDIDDLVSERYEYYDLVYKIIKELFVEEVKDDKVDWNIDERKEKIRYDTAVRTFECTKDYEYEVFDELSIEEKEKRKEAVIIDEDILKEFRKVEEELAKKIAELTISRIEKLVSEGKLKSPYTAARILLEITEDIPQEKYLVEDEVEKWKAHFCGCTVEELKNKSDDDIIEVYSFQCGDIGAKNFMMYGGNIGAPDGLFVFSKNDYEILHSEFFTQPPPGICKDIPGLSARLGNVPLGSNVVCIKQKVRLGDLETTKGSLSTAYFGEFGPPLSTQGGYDKDGNLIKGMYEAKVPQVNFLINGQENSNIEIISHSPNITSIEITEMAKLMLKRAPEVIIESNGKAKDNIEFFKKLDDDMEILQIFKQKLNEEERKYIAQLMIYLKAAMRREEQPKVGVSR